MRVVFLPRFLQHHQLFSQLVPRILDAIRYPETPYLLEVEVIRELAPEHRLVVTLELNLFRI